MSPRAQRVFEEMKVAILAKWPDAKVYVADEVEFENVAAHIDKVGAPKDFYLERVDDG